VTKDDIQLLFEYDRWANNRTLTAVSALNEEQFLRDLGGSFPSVRDTLAHMIGGEWLWLAYWKEPSPSADLIAELRTRRNALFHPDLLPNIAAVQSKWTEVEKNQIKFVNQVTDAALEATFPVHGVRIGLIYLMQHMANHSTYHRGQITLMLRQLNAKPIATDFHVFIAEGRPETPTP